MATPTVPHEKDVRDSSSQEKGSLAAPDYLTGVREDTALGILSQVTYDDPNHPIHWNSWLKWIIVTVYCVLQIFVTLTSTTILGIEFLVNLEFGGSVQSMFIVGNAVGPAFLGPLSDIAGRKWVYVGSILLYVVINCGTAKALNLPMLIIFQFLAGAAGSTALVNVAGTIADLFGDSDGAGQPMALFVLAANWGPSIGSPVGELIAENESLGWPWVFWLNAIIGTGFVFLMCFVPETLPRIVISKAAKRTNAVTETNVALVDTKINVVKEITFVTTMALRIMVTEPIVIFLALYNGFAYGLLFLYLDGVFDVFALNNGLSYLGADLTYLNFVVGVFIMFCFVPVQTYLFKRDRLKHGGARPEARFITSLVTVWLFPISLFWFAFTSNGKTSFWSPVVAGGVLGFSDPLLYLAMLNYIADSYPNVVASAIAAFLIPSFLLAAAFAHLGILLFDNLGTTWASATLAFISLGLVALVYCLWFFGPAMRRMSKLAISPAVIPSPSA
ncbi:hypothetical protein MMC25_007816 [Agyrium rufum]|nr:hypothetical protein [Agyrium rufum]